MTNPATSMTPSQIRRRANDYDSQIRLGLEEGSIRQVVKRLGGDLVSLLSLRGNGTPEQVAAFPKPLFLFRFVRAWNEKHNDPRFVDDQLMELERFDAAQRVAFPLPVSTPTPTATTPAPQQPYPTKPLVTTKHPAHRPKQSTPAPQPQQPQPQPRVKWAPTVPSPSPPPMPVAPTRHSQAPTHPHRAPHRDDSAAQPRKVVVEMPPRSPKKFTAIEEGSDEYSPSPSPPPPPPTQKKRRRPESDSKIRTVEIFSKSCERCLRGKRDCVVDELGAACVGCKARKYGCDYTGITNAKTMSVSRPVADSGSDIEVVEDRKGKKRRAESPVPAKKVKVKVEKVEKVEKPRGKGQKPKEERPKATASKSKGRRRPAPKSSAVVSDSSVEEVMMVDDGESEVEEPKPKRARLTKKNLEEEHEKRLSMLEERMRAFDKVANEVTRTSNRMDTMEGSVHRFAGALETFLARIQIDDRLRLVPDDRRISPGPLAITCPPSPSTLELPMDEDADADLADGMVDIQEGQMAHVGSIAPGSAHVEAAVPIPVSVSAPEPPPVPTPLAVPAPTVNVIPATPQGSQTSTIPMPSPPVVSQPPPPPPHDVVEVEPLPPPRNRSRTPAIGHLGVEGRTTRSRSRSKTPI